jgi:hypothetical protein
VPSSDSIAFFQLLRAFLFIRKLLAQFLPHQVFLFQLLRIFLLCAFRNLTSPFYLRLNLLHVVPYFFFLKSAE